MDYRSYQQTPRNQRRSQRMETASMALGTISAVSICMVYPSLICGALAIMFALLSRGGEMTFSPRAKTGLIIGSVSLGVIALMFLYTVVIANTLYGGMENMLRETYQSLGLDYDALLQNYN